MAKNNQQQEKQSYESDGVMGKDKKTEVDKQKRKQEEPMFFNTTPSSE